MSEQEYRPTFTLRNLLWTITFLGIAIGLLLPAFKVQRDGIHRRAQCQYNLKTLALAMHNYESAYKRLPIGIQVVDGANDTANTRGANWSWSVFILPYVEQQALYDMLDPRAGNNLSDRLNPQAYAGNLRSRLGNTAMSPSYEEVLNSLERPIPTFLCDSDRWKRDWANFRTGVRDSAGAPVTFPGSGMPFELGRTNYVAANSSSVCYGRTAGSANGETIAVRPDGAFDAVGGRKLRDFRDGQSNIVLIGERVQRNVRKSIDLRYFGREIPAGAGTVVGSRGIGNSTIDGSKINTCANAWGAPDVMFSAWGGINLHDPKQPYRRFQGLSSRHSGGVNVARADGSVSFIAEDIYAPGPDSTYNNKPEEMGPWQQLIAINDGDLTLKDFENQ